MAKTQRWTEETIPAELKALGLKPEDVKEYKEYDNRHVAVTHGGQKWIAYKDGHKGLSVAPKISKPKVQPTKVPPTAAPIAEAPKPGVPAGSVAPAAAAKPAVAESEKGKAKGKGKAKK